MGGKQSKLREEEEKSKEPTDGYGNPTQEDSYTMCPDMKLSDEAIEILQSDELKNKLLSSSALKDLVKFVLNDGPPEKIDYQAQLLAYDSAFEAGIEAFVKTGLKSPPAYPSFFPQGREIDEDVCAFFSKQKVAGANKAAINAMESILNLIKNNQADQLLINLGKQGRYLTSRGADGAEKFLTWKFRDPVYRILTSATDNKNGCHYKINSVLLCQLVYSLGLHLQTLIEEILRRQMKLEYESTQENAKNKLQNEIMERPGADKNILKIIDGYIEDEKEIERSNEPPSLNNKKS